MAFFGAPQHDPHHDAHAPQAALDMRVEVVKLQERWMREKQLDIRIGIGIHTGYAVVGNIGTDIIVSEDTRAAVADEFAFHAPDSIRVKGRETPIAVYSVQAR
jgi:class 3 adenylate cyclase